MLSNDPAVLAVEGHHPPEPETAYQEVLRTIGHRLDQEGWRAVALAEDRVGVVVQGMRPSDGGAEEGELRLTAGELYRDILAARGRRGQGPPIRRPRRVLLPTRPLVLPSPSAPAAAWPEADRYEGRLRALGWLSDRTGLRDVRVREEGHDLVLEGYRRDRAAGHVATYRLTPPDLQHMLEQLVADRHEASGILLEHFHDIAGYAFAGPYERGFIPHQAGVYLVLYGRGNWYLLDVDHANDIPSDLFDHPHQGCWDRLRQGHPLAVAIHTTNLPPARREELAREIRARFPDLPCGSP